MSDAVGYGMTSAGAILVLYLLLVIITRGIFPY
ncbi:dihydroorotate dehydrogenase [Paenibacillus sp. SI8]